MENPWGASQQAAPLQGLCIRSCLQGPDLTAFDDELLYETVSEINLFLEAAFGSSHLLFHHNDSNPKSHTKEKIEKDNMKST